MLSGASGLPRAYTRSPAAISTRWSVVATRRGACSMVAASATSGSTRNGAIRWVLSVGSARLARLSVRVRGDRRTVSDPPVGFGAQARVAIALVQVQRLPREDQVRIGQRRPGSCPQLWPAPGALEVHARNIPQRIATFDHIGVWRVGRQFRHGNTFSATCWAVLRWASVMGYFWAKVDVQVKAAMTASAPRLFSVRW